MVGPSGAGKTTWLSRDPRASELGIRAEQVVSSDNLRAELCGDFRSQERNAEVFAALHAIVKARVSHGLATVVDATNLRNKDRVAIAELTSGRVRYLVLDRPMEEKRRDAGWRAELPFDLLAKHAQTFASNLKDILAGDGLPNVEVVDLR
jgi:predicted kinase